MTRDEIKSLLIDHLCDHPSGELLDRLASEQPRTEPQDASRPSEGLETVVGDDWRGARPTRESIVEDAINGLRDDLQALRAQEARPEPVEGSLLKHLRDAADRIRERDGDAASYLDEANDALAALSEQPRTDAAGMREAIEQAATWFAEYAEGHAAKNTTDGDDKAKRNRERSEWLLARIDQELGEQR